jgi:hypothetical protein
MLLAGQTDALPRLLTIEFANNRSALKVPSMTPEIWIEQLSKIHTR